VADISHHLEVVVVIIKPREVQLVHLVVILVGHHLEATRALRQHQGGLHLQVTILMLDPEVGVTVAVVETIMVTATGQVAEVETHTAEPVVMEEVEAAETTQVVLRQHHEVMAQQQHLLPRLGVMEGLPTVVDLPMAVVVRRGLTLRQAIHQHLSSPEDLDPMVVQLVLGHDRMAAAVVAAMVAAVIDVDCSQIPLWHAPGMPPLAVHTVCVSL